MRSVLAVFASATASFAVQLPAPAPAAEPRTEQRREAPFRVLDNEEGAWIDLVTAPVRPLARRPRDGHLFALNTHDSRLVEFDPAGVRVRSLSLPWGPVALAFWDPAGAGEFLVVACRGTHALAWVELRSGAITALLELPSEPADVIVSPERGVAYVSCSGDDSVVEVDLEGARQIARHAIPSKRPTFLAPARDGGVLVAPLTSGNNSATDAGSFLLDPGDGRVLDLEDPSVAIQGLPDQDLFHLAPSGRLRPVARDMGAVLFALGVNPADGVVWQLGTEAHNKDASRFGEPAVRGDFVQNRLALAVPEVGSVVAPARVIDLDDADRATPGVQFDPTRTVGQPYALAFDDAGHGYITGLLTDNVTQLDGGGAFVREWDVGSLPRGILVAPDGSRAWVHCWGTNDVEVWELTAAPTRTAVLDLGFDPTPLRRQEGRRVFFDASTSMHGNASCASCHVDGDTDALVWDLSDLPADDKGPLVTQTLRGIEDLVPMHWRGERGDLIDFNGAFDGLLGGAPLDTGPGGAFEAFQDYLFSLHHPANPNEDPRRVVSAVGGLRLPGGQQVAADAVRGQDLFFERTVVPGIGSCNACHTLPTGTNNDVVLDEPSLEFPRRNHFVVASFNAVWRKESPTLETVVLADGTVEERPTIGAGVAATGITDGVLDFVSLPIFSLDATQERDVSAFLMQLDSGLAPAVHRAWLLDATGTDETWLELAGYLLPQAGARHADVAVFGTVDLGTGTRALRWTFDRAGGRFVCEDSSVAERDLAFFVEQARSGLGRNVFLGLPVGMGERFGIDFDADDLANLDELARGVDPYDPDTDGDGWPDGHEVQNGGDPSDPGALPSDSTAPVIENLRLVYATTRVAKIQFDTSEPTRFQADWVGGQFSGTVTSERLEKKHTVLLRDLRPNRTHTVTITAFDAADNTAQETLPGGVSTLNVVFPFDTMLRATSVTTLQDSGGTLHLRVEGNARFKSPGLGLAAGREIRVDVHVNDVPAQLDVRGTVSGADGRTSVDVIQTGLAPGDDVRVVVMALYDVQQNTSVFWSMPDTLPEDREFRVTYTGNGP